MFFKQFKSIFAKFYNWALDLLFPRLCLGCQKEGFFVCDECFQTLPIQKSASCFFCQKRLSRDFFCPKCKEKFRLKIDGIITASDWDNPLLREIIHRYKYSFIKELGEILAKIISEFLAQQKIIESLPGEKILVPVPLFKRRLLWRGFNQAEILAKILGVNFEIEVLEILERRRATFPQTQIQDKKTRQENIAGAFKIKFEFLNLDLRNKTIILVDDVSTTGATLNECAKTLKILKPRKILGLVVARG